MTHEESTAVARVRDLVMRERRLALSEREWKHRLVGYGYAITDTRDGRFVTSLVRNAAVCRLPGHPAG